MIRSSSVHSIYVGPVWSNSSVSHSLVYLGPLRSIMVQYVPTWLFRSSLVYFGPFLCTYLNMGKFKFELRVPILNMNF